MNIQNTTIAVILYKSKTLANGEHPLVLRIYKNNRRTYKYLGISCDPKLWDSKKAMPKISHPDKAILEKMIADTIAEYKSEVLTLTLDKRNFTSDSLLKKVENPLKNLTLFGFFDELIHRFEISNRIGNAHTYKDTRSSLKKFLANTDVTFSDIDFSFLSRWEAFQRQTVKEDTALSVRFRTLRSVYNKAIAENIARESEYPFKKFKISRFGTETKKRAIKKEDIKKIEALDLSGNTKAFIARQYFLFSYYGLGINFCDISMLQWKDLIGNRIYYRRQKSKGREINFRLMEEGIALVDYWRPITSGSPDNYIFPILDRTRHITATQVADRQHKVLGEVNKALKEIGKLAGIEIPLTTYVARHSFATVLKRSGISTEIISQAMNHKNPNITEIYLQNFDNDIIDEAQLALK